MADDDSVRYLLLSEDYVPLVGGHIMWLHEICRRLGNVRVLTSAVGHLPATEEADGVSIHRIRLKRHIFLRPESLFLYAKYLVRGALDALRTRPDVVIAARVLPEGLVANVVSKVLRIPSVIFAYGEEIATWGKAGVAAARRRLTGRLKESCLWRSFRATNRIVAISQFTRNLLIEAGVHAKTVFVVRPGTDPVRFVPSEKNREMIARLGLDGKQVLLTVGRLCERKGQDTVLRAMPAVLREVPNAVYLIAGDGEYGSELRELADSLGIAANVRFLGEVPQEELPDIYGLCDVFVMPNRVLGGNDVEGFGIVFLEANACGKPVIGGRSGGVPEAVVDGETGLLVDGSSPAAVAEAVLRLLRNPDLARRLGRAGRERVCRELTWDHTGAQVKRLIEETVRGFGDTRNRGARHGT